MLRKKGAWLALVMLLLPVLAACGPEPAAQSTPTNTTGVAEPTNTTVMVAESPTAMAGGSPTAMAGGSPTTAGTAQAQPTVAMVSATDQKYEVADCSYGGIIKGIEAVNETTVKFTLCGPDPVFPAKIAFSSLGIQSAKHLQATNGAPLEQTLGSGPYMVQEWIRGDHITLVENPNYWGEKPKVKTVTFRWNAEATARLNALKAGEADGIDNPDANDFESIQADTNLRLYPRQALNVFYIGMNNTKPPFDNEKVRQAIAMGINRQAILDKFYPDGSQLANYFTPCSIAGGCAGEPWYNYNLDEAKKMLSEAGVGNVNIRIAYRDVVRTYLPTPGRVAEEIQAQLAALGITATIDKQESTTFLDNASAGNLEMFLLGWNGDYPDATNFLDSHFGTGANNSFGTKWPDVTSKLQEAAVLADEQARIALYGEVNNLIRQHAPMIPVAHGASGTAYRANVQGAHSSPLGNESFKVVAVEGKDNFVWVQNGEPGSLYCADETDGEALRACEQIFDPLLSFKVGGVETELNLAQSLTPNADKSEWTVVLKPNLKFSDGSPLTATDVVVTYASQWDAKHPLHKGRTGTFDYWTYLFTAFLNPPPPAQ